MSGDQSDWELSKGLAKAILYDKLTRRKWVGRLVMATLGWMALGLWVIDDWLGDSPVRFLAWWGICAVMAVVMFLFAMYDALAVVREEREK